MHTPGSLEASVLLFYVISLIIILRLSRWVFVIDKRVKQNDSIINLLKLLAKKQGASEDEIESMIIK